MEKLLLSLNDVGDRSVEEAIRSLESDDVPSFSLEAELPIIRKCFHAKYFLFYLGPKHKSRSIENIIDNLKKDGSEFAQKQLHELSKMSPTSLKVTHKQITSGAKMSFSKIFTMEYRLTQRFMAGHDLHEGCRASKFLVFTRKSIKNSVLIDKDRNPKWNPASLDEVSDEDVEHYFAPLPHGEDLHIRDD